MSKTENKIKPLAIFMRYHELIKEYKEKYGEIINHVDKNFMYEKVAREFMISPRYAGQLIRYVITHQREFEPYRQDVQEVLAFLHKVKIPMQKFV